VAAAEVIEWPVAAAIAAGLVTEREIKREAQPTSSGGAPAGG